MFVIGTAGHVDHGKSELVKALTGIDPDRLSEEKVRGMTIDLGFAWLKLPSGREVSIVDVPGHERFVKNMLAGVGGIDLALLVIAADEGVMPQTREHLAILDLLQVKSGIVVIAKKDLVDDEWLELVTSDIEDVIKGTTLDGAPIVATSSVTSEGLQDLLIAIDRILETTPQKKDIVKPRLPIDRVFTMTGFGTVVTGTLIDGQLAVGQEVQIEMCCWPITLPEAQAASVRQLNGEVARFEHLSFPALTAFFAFRIDAAYAGKKQSYRFVLNLPIEGAPKDRKERLLRYLLKDRNQVLRLLLLMLADVGEGIVDQAAVRKLLAESQPEIGSVFSDALLEPLLQAVSRNPEKLDDIARLVSDLERTPEGQALLPEDFHGIWDPIWAAKEDSKK